MTECECNSCTDPQVMLEFLRGKVSDRKRRLFAVACCRRIWHMLTDRQSRKVVDLIEAYADGEGMTESDLHNWGWMRETKETWFVAFFRAWEAARATADNTVACVRTSARQTDTDKARFWEITVRRALEAEASPAEAVAAGNAAVPDAAEWFARIASAEKAEQVAQCDLLRCIFDNASHPVSRTRTKIQWEGTSHSWRGLDNNTVAKLAQASYDDRAFDRMPILADALEEAGCTDASILEHCRSGADHVRGCWVVDLVLGKE